MKKILSFAFVVAGISSLLAVTVSAAEAVSPAAVTTAPIKASASADMRSSEKSTAEGERREHWRRRGHGGAEKIRRGSHEFAGRSRGSENYRHHRGHPGKRHPAAVRAHARMKHDLPARRGDRLGLTDDQRAKMRQIAFQHRERVISLRKELRGEMESVLTPEQQAKAKAAKADHGRKGRRSFR